MSVDDADDDNSIATIHPTKVKLYKIMRIIMIN